MRWALILLLALMISAIPVSAIIIEIEKTEFVTGENITFKLYAVGNATVQLINETVVWESKVTSGTVSIPTFNLSAGEYTIFAADERGETVEDIRLIQIEPFVRLEILSRVEGNLSISGETNLPDGYRLKVVLEGDGSAEKEVEVKDGRFNISFNAKEGLHSLRVYLGNTLLTETSVYVEGFKIRSVKFNPEIYQGEPLLINITTNMKGYEVKITLYNSNREVKVRSSTTSERCELMVRDTWLDPGDYSIIVLVVHGNATDILKLPLKIKESFLRAELIEYGDGIAKVIVEAPANHTIWLVSETVKKKVVVGGDRKAIVELKAEKEVEIFDAMNRSDYEFEELLKSGNVSLPVFRLSLGGEKAEVEKPVKVSETETEEISNIASTVEKESEANMREFNPVAAFLTVVIVGGTLAGLVVMIRR
jgi:hypothetical protein